MVQADPLPLAAIEPGTLLAGKYRVERKLASGGMGVVVLVRHDLLGHLAAIKILLPQAAAIAGATERFLREARAAANLRSDHVAKVFDVGSLDDGLPYMVMEYLEGRDLADELEARGRLPVEEAVDCVLQALDALVEAHAIGVIHRDLKPSNLFLANKPDGSRSVKVLDFGISKVVGAGAASDGAVTTANAVLGSPAYMSPEQIRSSKDVDERTDVWSMGVVLYESVTGRRAFDGETMGAIMSAILTEDLPPIQSHVPGVPAGLGAVVARCLARDRAARYESIAALREALAPFGTSVPKARLVIHAQETVAARTADRAGTETTLAVSSERTPDLSTAPPLAVSSPSSRPRVVPLAAGAAAAVVAFALFVGMRGGATRQVASSATPASADPVASSARPAVAPSAERPPTVTPFEPAPLPAAPAASASAAPSASPAAPRATSTPRRATTPRATAAPKVPDIDLNQRN